MIKSFALTAFLAIIFAITFNNLKCPESGKLQSLKKAPKFWLFTTNNKYYVFQSIEKILLKLGLEKTEVNTSSSSAMHYDWDFLWSFECISIIPLNYSALNAHQRINQIPGHGHFATKSTLATYTDSKYVAKGFVDEESLKDFSENNPNVRYVQKHSTSRGVLLKNASELEFTIKGGQHGLFGK